MHTKIQTETNLQAPLLDYSHYILLLDISSKRYYKLSEKETKEATSLNLILSYNLLNKVHIAVQITHLCNEIRNRWT